MEMSMKKVILFFLSMVFLMSITGCASSPSVDEFSKADFGVYPENYQELVKESLKYQLFDPISAQFEFIDVPKQGAWDRGIINGGGHEYGWIGFVMINAKNRYGGYTGYQNYIYVIKNNFVKVRADDGLARGLIHFK